MQVRMIPVEAVFLPFPRLVRDLSTKLDKHVELKLVGQDTELDRTVVDALGDPLVHLVGNSLDHGLEPPEARVAAGKPATGTLEISARHAGGSVVIGLRDDGRGLDPAKIAAKAADSPFAVPLERVERTLSLTEHAVRSVAGRRMLVLRDGVLPLIDAGFALQDQPGDGEWAVIVRAGRGRLALAVDRLVGQRELVTRLLPGGVSVRAAISSGAVLPNGRIALIIDCDSLAAPGTPGAALAA